MVMHVLVCLCHNQDKEEEKQIRSGKGRKLEEKFLKLAGIPEISRNLSQARITKGLPVLVSISVQEFPDLTTLHLTQANMKFRFVESESLVRSWFSSPPCRKVRETELQRRNIQPNQIMIIITLKRCFLKFNFNQLPAHMRTRFQTQNLVKHPEIKVT